ncbi:MAG: DUF2281 domain-containing protein [Balneolaceae bacterium]
MKISPMTRKTLIKKIVDQLKKLPDRKVREISDFADFLSQKIENEELVKGIEKLASDSFNFLEDEEDLYSLEDLKEKY